MKDNTYAPVNSVIDLLLDTICVVDRSGRFVFVSAGCEHVFGYTQKEMIGKSMIKLVHPEDRAKTLQEAGEVMAGKRRTGFENRYVRKDGQVVYIQWSARWSDSDQLRIAVARDVTKSKRGDSMKAALYAISEAAHTVEDQFSLFQRIHQIIDNLIPITHFTIACYDEANVAITCPYNIDHPDSAGASWKLDRQVLCAEVIRSGRVLLITPDMDTTILPLAVRDAVGNDPSASWLGVPLKSHNGTIGALMMQSHSQGLHYNEDDSELLQFVSTQIATAIERKQMLARLQHIALYDQLSGLPNRELFYDRVHLALARARRERGQLALLYLDLDRFKQVNDTFGHAVGDMLLQSTAQRVLECVRASDTVSRFGGDEFVILLENIDFPESAAAVAEKILDALSESYQLLNQEIFILPSIGIAIFPQDGNDVEELLHHADKAMYVAKKCGGNKFYTKH